MFSDVQRFDNLSWRFRGCDIAGFGVEELRLNSCISQVFAFSCKHAQYHVCQSVGNVSQPGSHRRPGLICIFDVKRGFHVILCKLPNHVALISCCAELQQTWTLHVVSEGPQDEKACEEVGETQSWNWKESVCALFGRRLGDLGVKEYERV